MGATVDEAAMKTAKKNKPTTKKPPKPIRRPARPARKPAPKPDQPPPVNLYGAKNPKRPTVKECWSQILYLRNEVARWRGLYEGTMESALEKLTEKAQNACHCC